MPLVSISVSQQLDVESKELLKKICNDIIVELLGKPQKYIMVIVRDKEDIFFDGSNLPAAYLEVKNIGEFTPEKTKELSKRFCDHIEKLGIPPNRVYIEYNDAKRYLWGYNRTTF